MKITTNIDNSKQTKKEKKLELLKRRLYELDNEKFELFVLMLLGTGDKDNNYFFKDSFSNFMEALNSLSRKNNPLIPDINNSFDDFFDFVIQEPLFMFNYVSKDSIIDNLLLYILDSRINAAIHMTKSVARCDKTFIYNYRKFKEALHDYEIK